MGSVAFIYQVRMIGKLSVYTVNLYSVDGTIFFIFHKYRFTPGTSFMATCDPMRKAVVRGSYLSIQYQTMLTVMEAPGGVVAIVARNSRWSKLEANNCLLFSEH